MQASGIPTKFLLRFGQNAAGALIRAIPVASQINITPGAASLNDGFPPLTNTPTSAGGVPPAIQDFNGILNMLSAWAQWQATGGPVQYDSAFSTSIGGYENGAVLAAAGVAGYYWISTADNNTSNPDSGGANWVPFNLYGTNTTGDVKLSFKTVADPGYILMNDGSIGNAASGATTLASALTGPLFTLLYNNVVDSWAPIQTSVGGATTRGAQGSAATAYAANCRLVLPLALGRAICVAGAGSGLTSRALGQNLGEETHLLVTGEMPSHGHNLIGETSGAPEVHGLKESVTSSVGGVNAGLGSPAYTTNANFGALAGSPYVQSTGGGGAHNNMQPSSFLTAMIAL